MDGAARRRNEIEAKKAKLAELRRLREERQQSVSASSLQEPSGDTKSTSTVSQIRDRRALDDLVNSLVGDIPSTRKPRYSDNSAAEQPEFSDGDKTLHEEPAERRTSHQQWVTAPETSVTAQAAEMCNLQEPTERDGPVLQQSEAVHNFKEKSVITYTKATQTQTDELLSEDDVVETDTLKTEETYAELVGRLRAEIEHELRQKVVAENEAVRIARDTTIEKRTEPPEIETEDLNQGLPVLQDEVHSSRTLPDYTQDIEITHNGMDDRSLTQIFEFSNDSTKHRMITSISWSLKFSELVLASYSKSQVLNNSVHGLVHVWNTRAPGRPEFTLTCQSEVQHAMFSPYHANIIVGGTYSGQIMVWDIKIKTQPILITPLNGKGHTYPITGLNIVGTKQASSIVSTSSDGTVCTWSPDILAQPQDIFELALLPPSKVEEVNPTAVSHSPSDTATFMIGTEDGNMYSVNRQDRAGARAGIDSKHVYKGHAAMITGADHHRCRGHLDLSDLILTSSLDWTVRLWRLATSNCLSTSITTGPGGQGATIPALMEFNCDDMVYDVRWSPTNPAVFAMVDGLGNCHVYDLCRNTEIPVASSFASTTSDDASVVERRRALNKLGWDLEGQYLAIGGLDGKLVILALPASLTDKSNTSNERWALLNNRLKAAARK